MHDLYDNHWRYFKSSWAMKLSVFLSIAFHVFVGYSLMIQPAKPKPKPTPISVQVAFTTPEIPDSDIKQEEMAPPPPPPPPPPPEPKKPEPKKPEPKKPEPKKPEPKKPEPKKPEPKKPVPKEPIMPTKPVKPPPEVVAKPQEQGIKNESLPHILNAWAALVQRKVDRKWRTPGGIQLNEENKEVHISFWVNRNGKILGTPEIVKNAADPALGKAALLAIKAAEPLPQLPNEFLGEEQQVLYVFTLLK